MRHEALRDGGCAPVSLLTAILLKVALEVVLVFGDAVSRGGFVPVTLVVVALLVSRAAARRLLYGAPAAASSAACR